MGRMLDRYKQGATGRVRSGPARISSTAVGLLARRAALRKQLELRRRLGLLKGKNERDMNEVERQMLDHELAIARDLQAHLLPRQLPQIPHFDIAAYYRSSREVGGDYYDFFPMGPERYAIAVGDVSGKGIPASIVMAELRILLRVLAAGQASPRAILVKVNHFLYQDIMRGMFVTLFLAVYEPHSRIVTMCSAGHNPTIYRRKSNASCYLINPPGMALGLDRGPLFERTLKEQRLKLQPGDRLVLYTDGVVEVFDKDRNPYAVERLYRLVRDKEAMSSSEIVREILKDIETHRGDAPQHDDITLVALRLVEGAAPHGTVLENLL